MLKTDEELVKEMKSGEVGAEEELFSRFKPMVSSVARSYFLLGSELDDLIQEGMIGLYKACQNYSQNSSASFKTFAYLCIKRQIQSAVKHANRQKNKILNSYVSLDSQGGYKTGDGEEEALLILPSSILTPDDEMIEKENYEEILDKIKRALSPLELKVLTLYLKGNSYQNISKVVGKNTKSVDNSLHRIKNKLEFLKH